MEFFLVAIVSLAVPLSMASIAFTLDLVVVAAEIAASLLELAAWLLSGRARCSQPVRKKHPWRRRILLAALAVLCLLLAGVWFVNRFHFEPFMRWGAARLETSAGVAVDFESVSGSLWTGELRFTGLSMKRANHPLSTFDVVVDRADMQVSVLRLLWRQLRLESLTIEGVRGTWTRQGKAEQGGALRTFSISDFNLGDFRIDYHNLLAGTAARPVELRVDAMQSYGLSSNWLILQLLFLSRAEGAIDGAPFFIGVDPKTPNVAALVWKCEGLPLTALASLAGKPLTL